MKCLKRNMTAFYYALYSGKTKRLDSDGNDTGEKTVSYGTPVAFRAYITPEIGAGTLSFPGEEKRYEREIITADMSIPLTETSVLWIGVPTSGPYNYRVVSVSRSLNHVRIGIRSVDGQKEPVTVVSNGETNNSP